jgi:hypothetical protein
LRRSRRTRPVEHRSASAPWLLPLGGRPSHGWPQSQAQRQAPAHAPSGGRVARPQPPAGFRRALNTAPGLHGGQRPALRGCRARSARLVRGTHRTT